jgi:uncharacterized protein YdcH (DUF465 family)
MLSRKDLTSSMRVIIDKWDNEIDGLEEDIHKFEGERKKAYDKRIGELKDQKSALQEEVDSIQAASDKGLEEIEEGFETAKEKFKETMEKAKDLFSQSK